MAKKDKGKIVQLPQEVRSLRFPEGDPRNDMTDEEIARYAQLEEIELNKELGKFIIASQQFPAPADEQEDEEEESFTVDLANKKVEQKLGEGIITAGGDMLISGDITGSFATLKPMNLEAVENPYTRLITDVIVRKAVASLIAKMNEYISAMEEGRYKNPVASIGSGINKELDEYYSKKNSLRLSIQGNKVDYGKIPDWAKSYIEGYIERALSSLIILSDE